MAEAYAYTPEVWPPLTAAVLVAAIALYSWRRRDVPAALPLAACALLASLSLLGNALAALAAAPATILFWHRFQAAGQLPGLTAGTCFALEYAFPGRWLTRRNLALLAIAPFLLLLLIVVDGGQVVWRRLEIAADGSILRDFTHIGFLVLAYALGLVLLNAAALFWLFAHSPQHRWPVALILSGQIANRLLYLLAAKTTLSAERPFFPTLREFLSRFTQQYGLPVELMVPPQLEAQGLPQAVEVQLLRIIQEALSNVRKHAGARCAHVIFSPAGAQVHAG
jgi:hypothetical protein